MTVRYKNNVGGPVVAVDADAGNFIEKDGLYFRDLQKDGQLYPYEDWRLSSEERAKDLVRRLSVRELAGLMQYASYQMVPGMSTPYWGQVTYGGKPFPEAKVPVYEITDQQKKWMTYDAVRNFTLGVVQGGASNCARWVNNLQACAESLPHGIPVNLCSDPRHGTSVTFEYDMGANGDISHWPEALGLAATFDPELVKQFAKAAATEYRLMGLTTALSPQIDLATEPRWMRFSGTFGENSRLSADMARAYCDGFQQAGGEGAVNAMAKHWPGGGADESGRDAHYGTGKYSVFPGENFEEHQIPFTEGAFQLEDGSGCVSAVMPYYTVAYGQDRENGENVGISYNRYLITTLLREKYGFDGVVCTDWGITRDPSEPYSILGGKCWGVEELSQAQRIYKAIEAGVDQFGGLSDTDTVLEAYEIGVQEHGKEYMRKRFEQSAERILRNMFRIGLFDNPYVDVEKSEKVVGSPELIRMGFEAQKKSVILLKNKNNILPLRKKAKVFIPKQYHAASMDFFGQKHEEYYGIPVSRTLLDQYLETTETIEEADVVISFVRMPGGNSGITNGFDLRDKENGGNGYVPISLQYHPYTANSARKVSIAGGDPFEDFTNRSYFGKTVTSVNESDVTEIERIRREYPDKPIVAVATLMGPVVVSEYEDKIDALVVSVGELYHALLSVITGETVPSGLLPMQLPANMDTVEKQYEDVPFDMECHVDTEGHIYDFGFGMDFNGVIFDERVTRYGHRNGVSERE